MCQIDSYFLQINIYKNIFPISFSHQKQTVKNKDYSLNYLSLEKILFSQSEFSVPMLQSKKTTLKNTA